MWTNDLQIPNLQKTAIETITVFVENIPETANLISQYLKELLVFSLGDSIEVN